MLRLLSVLLLGLLVVGCRPVEIELAPVIGGQDTKGIDLNALAYADHNGDGIHTEDEPGIADVLVVASSNIHGSMDRRIWQTGEDGRARVDGAYTHFFDVWAVPPCGYAPTTPTEIDATDVNALAFGFEPTGDPQTGTATLIFEVWIDTDNSGTRDPDEQPAAGVEFLIAPEPVPPQYMHDLDFLVFTTDQNGEARVELGNSCGTVHFTGSRSAAEDTIRQASYTLGETRIGWPLQPAE